MQAVSKRFSVDGDLFADLCKLHSCRRLCERWGRYGQGKSTLGGSGNGGGFGFVSSSRRSFAVLRRGVSCVARIKEFYGIHLT